MLSGSHVTLATSFILHDFVPLEHKSKTILENLSPDRSDPPKLECQAVIKSKLGRNLLDINFILESVEYLLLLLNTT